MYPKCNFDIVMHINVRKTRFYAGQTNTLHISDKVIDNTVCHYRFHVLGFKQYMHRASKLLH